MSWGAWLHEVTRFATSGGRAIPVDLLLAVESVKKAYYSSHRLFDQACDPERHDDFHLLVVLNVTAFSYTHP